MTRGSCLCGGVAFEASDQIELRNCHCSRCRKARGAAYAANLFVPAGGFRWLRGEDLLINYRLPNTQRFGNSFCRICGSPSRVRFRPATSCSFRRARSMTIQSFGQTITSMSARRRPGTRSPMTCRSIPRALRQRDVSLRAAAN